MKGKYLFRKFSESNWTKLFKTDFTFSLICFAWIIFRANNFPDARVFISSLIDFRDQFSGLYPLIDAVKLIPAQVNGLWLSISFILFLLIDREMNNNRIKTRLYHFPKVIRWSFYYVVIIWILFFGMFHNAPHFIYFQF